VCIPKLPLVAVKRVLYEFFQLGFPVRLQIATISYTAPINSLARSSKIHIDINSGSSGLYGLLKLKKVNISGADGL